VSSKTKKDAITEFQPTELRADTRVKKMNLMMIEEALKSTIEVENDIEVMLHRLLLQKSLKWTHKSNQR